MTYEALLIDAEKDEVEVFEKKMTPRFKGLYGNNIIWINRQQSSIEKNCTLAEELGHHYTTHGDILDQSIVENIKQEKKAHKWAYKKLVPLSKIVQAHKTGIRNRYELAEYLQVTEQFLDDALKRYIEEHGLYMEVNGTTLCLQPLGVLEMF